MKGRERDGNIYTSRAPAAGRATGHACTVHNFYSISLLGVVVRSYGIVTQARRLSRSL